jgi:hypothetical protein
MCDERGASINAPAPILPTREAKLETAAPSCKLAVVPTLVAAAASHRGRAVIAATAFDEAWVSPGTIEVDRFDAGRAPPGIVAVLPQSAGYRRGVFRPPRA